MRNIFYASAVLLLLCSMAVADINPLNSRPVAIGNGPTSELTLQQILDSIYGVNVVSTADQQQSGIWQLPGPGTDVSAPTLRFEEAGNKNSNVFGLWTAHDPSAIIMVPIFSGPASPTTIADIFWDAGDPNTLHIRQVSGTGVNVGDFAGMNRYWFGFYLQGLNGTFFTADQLNGGNPQALAFVGPGNRWTLAFEDRPYANTDRDYNDMVVTAESITPVPDGSGTLILLGLALVGFETLRWRVRA